MTARLLCFAHTAEEAVGRQLGNPLLTFRAPLQMSADVRVRAVVGLAQTRTRSEPCQADAALHGRPWGGLRGAVG